MIIYPCTSLFDCLPPTLEDDVDDRRWPHPSLPGVSVNALGVLDFDPKKMDLVFSRNKFYLKIKSVHGREMRPKIKVVWECYHGRETSDTPVFLDFNPYNYTVENLGIIKHLSAEQKKIRGIKRSLFLTKTCSRLDAFLSSFPHFSPEDCCQVLMVPHWIATAWLNTKSVVRSPSTSFRKPITPDKPGDGEVIKTLFFSNVPLSKIAEALDWGSSKRVRDFVTRQGWVRASSRGSYKKKN